MSRLHDVPWKRTIFPFLGDAHPACFHPYASAGRCVLEGGGLANSGARLRLAAWSRHTVAFRLTVPNPDTANMSLAQNKVRDTPAPRFRSRGKRTFFLNRARQEAVPATQNGAGWVDRVSYGGPVARHQVPGAGCRRTLRSYALASVSEARACPLTAVTNRTAFFQASSALSRESGSMTL